MRVPVIKLSEFLGQFAIPSLRLLCGCLDDSGRHVIATALTGRLHKLTPGITQDIRISPKEKAELKGNLKMRPNWSEEVFRVAKVTKHPSAEVMSCHPGRYKPI